MQGWTGQGKRGLTHQLSLRLFGVGAVVLAVLCGVWVQSEVVAFEQAAARVRDDALRERKALLRDVVEQTADAIDYQRHRAKTRIRDRLRRRVSGAAEMAGHLWETYAGERSRPEVEGMIREALRSARYDDGRGYFFAFDRDLTGQLVASRALPEGQDLSGTRDGEGRPVVADIKAAVDNDGGRAFHGYLWAGPELDDAPRPKLSYVQYVESLGWYVGAGEYLATMERDIQKEIRDWLGSIRFAESGYVFAATWDGVSLAGPGAGRTVLDVEDATGRKVVRDLIALARDGGGFLEYLQPSVPDADGYRTERKLSYVLPIPDWRWYVGAGLYIDDIEAQVTTIRADLETKIRSTLLKGLGLFLLLGVVAYWLSRRATRSLARDVVALETYFLRDGRDPAALDPDAMQSRETDILARAARAMARGRDSAEAVLAERSRQLERTNADLERFAWIASHDLQEPLRSVASFLQLLERKLGPRLTAEESEYLGFAVQGARRMRLQITALMAYSRQSSEGLEVEDVALDDLARETLAIFADALRGVGATVEIEGLPVVAANAALVATVFQNLISNSIKFRDPDRPLRLRLTAEETAEDGRRVWRIAVADNGTGIPPAYRDDAFALLKRLHGQEIPGTGVGLAMVKKLVEAHGGEVGIADGLDGAGVTVWFTLPA